MSEFYTYERLKENFPTKDAVIKTRDAVLDYLERVGTSNAVVYGSVIWGLHKRFDDQHTRRSDVDVALAPESYSSGSIFGITDFCKKLNKQTGVPVEIIAVGETEVYQALINPSTADHFRLLAKRFPKMPYKAFKQQMIVNFQERVSDLDYYLTKMWGYHKELTHEMQGGRRLKREIDWREPGNLEQLSKFENFPDHLIRKVLGRENILPCPDSKEHVREIFRGFSYQWIIRDKLLPLFEKVFTSSQEYEELIDDVSRGLLENAYYEKLERIAGKIIENTGKMFEEIRGSVEQFLGIIRIPEGSPVIILNHYKNGRGCAEVARLSYPFGNSKSGVQYPMGYARKAIYGTEPDDPLIKGWEKTEIFVHNAQRNLDWIKDPLDSENGWFTYKKDTGVYSIKQCSDKFFDEFEDDGDKDSDDQKYVKFNRGRYPEFVKTALNPNLSFVPRTLRKRISNP